jgi:uncharacterized protein YidB (DUF937 family)/outer membrane protein OmpA-like peptidoglycan-associated protein
MSLFDSIISTAGDRFGLGDKAGTLLSALLALMTDQNRGGFAGFLDRFSQAGLGDTVSSWIGSGASAELSDEQVETALGNDTITELANQADVNASSAKSALAYMIPNVVDKLTPDGVVPEEKDLLSRIGDFLSGWGGAIAGAGLGAAGAVGAMASGAFDKAGDTGKAVVGKGVEVAGRGVDMVGDAAGATVDAGKAAVGAVTGAAGSALNSVGDAFDGDGEGGGILKWLLPLILLGLLLLLGFWFCGKAPTPTPTSNANTNVNANANKATTNVNANANTSANANANATADTARTLTEVTLPNGTKLQAFPGGIEDQLIKFIQSDEYKNATAESLKEKWFNFDDLNFKFGTTELVPESKRQLDNITAILKAFPDVKMKIGGYTDKKGDDAANKKLSDNRAKAVKAALEKAGVGAQVPEAEGYGEERATVAETASDQERAVDRKTSVRLIKGEAKTTEANSNTAKPAAANTNANK